MKIADVKADKMRFQTNAIAYALVLYALAFGVVALFTLITYDTFGEGDNPSRVVPDFRIGVEIAVSILMMLLTFLAAEKIKFYHPVWSSAGLIVLAGVTLLRIADFGDFYQGITFYCYDRGWIPSAILLRATAFFAVSGLLLAAAALISIRNVIVLRAHMKELNAHGHDAA